MKRRYIAIACVFLLITVTLSGCPAPDPGDEPPVPPAPIPKDEPQDPDSPISSEVTVHVLNVREELCVFIDDNDVEVLIDGGYMKDGKNISAYIRDYVDGDIEYVIATHSDSDHVGGFVQIYSDYQIDCTIYGDESEKGNSPKFKDAAMNEPNSEYRNDIDETIELSDGVTLRIEDVIDDADDTNDNSVISLLDVSGQKLLITGDAQAATENLLLGKIGLVDVYVVGHHGSETSSSQSFLDEIRPEYGIISTAGPSHRDHNPDEGVMQRLSAIGTKLYATYRSGNITVTFDGGQIRLSPPVSEQITPDNYKKAA